MSSAGEELAGEEDDSLQPGKALLRAMLRAEKQAQNPHSALIRCSPQISGQSSEGAFYAAKQQAEPCNFSSSLG